MFNGHLLLSRPTAAADVLVEQIVRLRQRHVVVHIQMLRAGLPVAMRGLVMIHQEERLVLVPLLLKESQRFVRDDVGRIARVFDDTLGRFHRRIVIGPLADQYVPIVEAGRLALEMPLTDDGRLIAGLLQQLGDGLLASVERVAVSDEAVQMAVLACQDNGPARPTDRVGTEGVVESNALVGQPIEIGRLIDLAAIGRDGMRGMVVAHDVDDIGPLGRFLGGPTERRHTTGDQQQGHQRAKSKFLHRTDLLGQDQDSRRTDGRTPQHSPWYGGWQVIAKGGLTPSHNRGRTLERTSPARCLSPFSTGQFPRDPGVPPEKGDRHRRQRDPPLSCE